MCYFLSKPKEWRKPARSLWDGGECILCMGWWGFKTVHRTVENKIVHGMVGNEICAWDDGE